MRYTADAVIQTTLEDFGFVFKYPPKNVERELFRWKQQ